MVQYSRLDRTNLAIVTMFLCYSLLTVAFSNNASKTSSQFRHKV